MNNNNTWKKDSNTPRWLVDDDISKHVIHYSMNIA